MTSKSRSIPTPRPGERRASAYLLILATSLLVTVIGVSALIAARVQGRMATSADDVVAAQLNARSGLNLALLAIDQDSYWRQTCTHGVWQPSVEVGEGECKWKLLDPEDGDLDNDPNDPVLIEAWGMVGRATQKTTVRLEPDLVPLEALGTCIHTAQRLRVDSDAGLIVRGAAASTNADLDVDGMLYGDAEADVSTGDGTITGSLTVPTDSKALPAGTVFADYLARATVLPFNGDMEAKVLAPGVNEYGGGLNPDGVYFIDTGGSSMIIRDARVYGTLVIESGSGDVTLEGEILMQNYRADYPVLIVKGDLDLHCSSKGPYLKRFLDEDHEGHNYNPAGAPYQDETDLDKLDAYPSEIRGLIHVTGRLQIENTPRVVGTIICHQDTLVSGLAEIVFDPAIAPVGYGTPGPMQPVPGSSQRVVD